MNRILITVVWLGMLMVTRIADVATTYHFTPDLSHEGNPIASVLGGGWFALLSMNMFLVVLIGVFAVVYCRAAPYSHLAVQSRSVWDFAALGLYGRKMSKREFLLRQLILSFPPKGHRAMFCQLVGFVLPPVMITGGLLAVFAWFAIYEWKLHWFIQLHVSLSYIVLIVPCVIVLILATITYFITEYRRALSEIAG